MNYMKMVEFVGMSGPINFDTSGLRTEFEMDLMELQHSGLAKVGTWNSLDRLDLSRVEKKVAESGIPDPFANKTFVITAILVRIINISNTFLSTEMYKYPLS